MTVKAKFPSGCAWGKTPVNVGDVITPYAKTSKRSVWIHDECNLEQQILIERGVSF